MESAEIQNSHSPQRISTSLPPISKEETGKSNKNRRKKLEKIRMENNATTIQKVWRGKQSRLELSRKVASLENFAPIKAKDDPQSPTVEENSTQLPETPLEVHAQLEIKPPLDVKPSLETKITQPNTDPPNKSSDPPQSQAIPVSEPQWPSPLGDNFDTIDKIGTWPNLGLSDDLTLREWVLTNKKVLVRTITWNMCANEPPAKEVVQKVLLPLDKFHILIIGTEECERSIAKSAVNPSKKGWEAYLVDAVGANYVPMISHTLQAIHLMFFVHKAIRPLISDVTSAAVACGMANTLGNKGGVGISFCVGLTRFVVINSHLAANQNKTKTRNRQFHKICAEMTPLLKKKMVAKEKKEEHEAETSLSSSATPQEKMTPADGQDDEDEEDGGEDKLDEEYRKKSSQLEHYGDRIIFMGDMNYRINGNRRMIDQLLSVQMHEVLLSNDQLKISMSEKQLPSFFQEAPLNFYPTYKLDIGSNTYDSGPKKRIPSWTDRILYKPTGIRCLAYDSVPDITISDHRPVYGSFLIDIEATGIEERNDHEFRSESQVCRIS